MRTAVFPKKQQLLRKPKAVVVTKYGSKNGNDSENTDQLSQIPGLCELYKNELHGRISAQSRLHQGSPSTVAARMGRRQVLCHV